MQRIKKILVALPVVIITVILLTGFVYAEEIKTGLINADSVNMRETPSTTAKILMQLAKETKINVVGIQGDWYKITYNNSNGWVFGKYITLRKASVSRGDTSSPSAAADGKSENTDVKDIRQQIVEYAKKFLGVRYVYGSSSPSGFDCSGFVLYVFKHFDINLERTSSSQADNGVKISRDDLKPGDLLFFDTNGGLNAVNHVGIYIGGGSFIHASSGGGTKCVTISDMTEGFYNRSYMRSRRYIND